jgi:hypothetical protein
LPARLPTARSEKLLMNMTILLDACVNEVQTHNSLEEEPKMRIAAGGAFAQKCGRYSPMRRSGMV